MKTILKISFIFLALVLIAWPTQAHAQGVSVQGFACEKFVLGGDIDIGEGEVVPGDLCIVGGSAHVGEGAIIEGDVWQAGGDLTISGTVEGDLNVVGGYASLEPTAVIEQNVNIIGGQVDGLATADVQGTVSQDEFENIPLNFNFPDVKWNPFSFYNNMAWNLLWLPLRSFLWAAAAVILALLFPRAVERVGQTSVHQAFLSGGMGCATLVIAIMVFTALAITIICIPFSMLGGVLLLAAWGFGIIGLGTEIGLRLAILSKQEWALALCAALGTFLLTLVVNGISLAIPCVGGLVPLIVGLIGLGAVVLTRFGSESYPQPLAQPTAQATPTLTALDTPLPPPAPPVPPATTESFVEPQTSQPASPTVESEPPAPSEPAG
jgi:hypothetical protein